jgi:hypothetical protein
MADATEGGLQVYSSIGNGAGSSVNVAFKIASADATDMFEGDLMKLVNTTGGVVAATAATDSAGLVGVFVGCEYTSTETGQRVWSNKYLGTTNTITADDTVAFVNVGPNQLYKIRIGSAADTDGTATREDMIGGKFDLDFNAGNAVTGKSGMILDSGTAQIATVAQVSCVGVSNNDYTDDAKGAQATVYTHAIVMIDPLANFLAAGPGIVA